MAKIEISNVKSGYDIELLLSEHYVKYILLCLYESGSIPSVISSQLEIGSSKIDYQLYPYPPPEIDERRLYTVNQNFNKNPLELVGSLTDENSFKVTLEEVIDQGAKFKIDLKIAYRFKDNNQPNYGPAIEDVAISLIADIFLESDISIGSKILKIIFREYRGVGPRNDILTKLQETKLEYDLSAFGDSFQKIELKSYKAGNPLNGDGPAALGVYINLNLKTGPEEDSIIADRGDILNAINFLPTGLSQPESDANHHIGFVLNGSIYKHLGQLIKNGFATIERDKICEGEFSYPKDLGTGFHHGHIADVSVSPVYVTDTNHRPIALNKLRIKLETEEFTYPNIEITLSPLIDEDSKLMKWDIDLHVQDAPLFLLGSLLLSLVEMILIPGLGPYIINVILDYFLINFIIDTTQNSSAENEVNNNGILEKIPNCIGISDKNWDAFITTSHKVNSSIEQMDITTEGIVLLGKSLWLDRANLPDKSIAIHQLVRDSDANIIAIQFRTKRMKETIKLINDIESPAMTRPEEFSLTQFIPTPEVDSPNAERIIQLSIEEIETRIGKQAILEQIPLLPMRIDASEGKISNYLALSKYDYDVFYNLVKTNLIDDASIFNEIRTQAINELATQGCNEPQNAAKLNLMIKSILEERILSTMDESFDEEIGIELNTEDIEFLKEKKIITFVNRTDLLPFVLVNMKNGTRYFRDRADGKKKDNLRSLPRYKSRGV